MKTATVICIHCKKPFEKEIKRINEAIKLKWNHFCSQACQNNFKKRGFFLNCEQCGKPVYKRSTQIKKYPHHFCNRKCATIYNNKFKTGESHPNWDGGSASYRQRALKFYGTTCHDPNCPIPKSIKIPLELIEVHHKDSNRDNNDLENLEVLCVYSHTYKTRCKKSQAG